MLIPYFVLGMVPNVDNIRRLQTQMNNPQMYQVPQQFDQQPRGANGWQTGGGYFGKLMVGTMAGLMVVQGFGEAEQTTNTPNARGKSSTGCDFLSLSRFWKSGSFMWKLCSNSLHEVSCEARMCAQSSPRVEIYVCVLFARLRY